MMAWRLHEIRTYALIPGSQLRIIENAGHISNLEKPEVVAGHLADFLRQTIGAGEAVGFRRIRSCGVF